MHYINMFITIGSFFSLTKINQKEMYLTDFMFSPRFYNLRESETRVTHERLGGWSRGWNSNGQSAPLRTE